RRNKSLEALIAASQEHADFEDRQRADREAADLFQETVYAEAAYSMGAVGMLAPFLETIFHQAFLAMGRELYSEATPPPSHDRWTMTTAEKWDCRYVLENRKLKKNLVKGVLQISEATGVLSYLPSDLQLRLQALFSYRNAMFHNGFEWPQQERDKFEAKTRS